MSMISDDGSSLSSSSHDATVAAPAVSWLQNANLEMFEISSERKISLV
jgi:hypothetical protein